MIEMETGTKSVQIIVQWLQLFPVVLGKPAEDVIRIQQIPAVGFGDRIHKSPSPLQRRVRPGFHGHGSECGIPETGVSRSGRGCQGTSDAIGLVWREAGIEAWLRCDAEPRVFKRRRETVKICRQDYGVRTGMSFRLTVCFDDSVNWTD
jgi:hypothetical protein